MPRITRPADRIDAYEALRLESRAAGERNDCTVIALAATCKASYAAALAALADAGRKRGKGVPTCVMEVAARALGFQFTRVPLTDIISRYPAPHNGLRNVTTHHPDRFPRAWPPGAFLLFPRGHVSAVVDGRTHDWARGRALRVHYILRVTPANEGVEKPFA